VTYTWSSIAAVIGVLLIDRFVLRTSLTSRKAFWVTYGIVLFFQIIVNGLLTGLNIVTYDRHAIVGLRLVNAPVEDVLFGFAMVTLTLSSWVWWGRRDVNGFR
jgi:lycopene cyclase domain-containing protein